MIITINPIKQYTYAVHLNLPYTADEIIKEINQCELVQWGPGRYSTNMRSKILSEIEQVITEYPFIEKFHETNDFKLLWKNISLEEFKKKVKFSCGCLVDKPGFSLSPHLDSRQIVITGMIFLNPVNDVRQNTILYDDPYMKNPKHLPSNIGEGWVMCNTHTTWHSGRNLSDQNRYSILFDYTI
jgi:hypothetical protein